MGWFNGFGATVFPTFGVQVRLRAKLSMPGDQKQVVVARFLGLKTTYEYLPTKSN